MPEKSNQRRFSEILNCRLGKTPKLIRTDDGLDDCENFKPSSLFQIYQFLTVRPLVIPPGQPDQVIECPNTNCWFHQVQHNKRRENLKNRGKK